MENNLDNTKLIHGDEKAPNQSQTLPPLDEASCSASSLVVELREGRITVDQFEKSLLQELATGKINSTVYCNSIIEAGLAKGERAYGELGFTPTGDPSRVMDNVRRIVLEQGDVEGDQSLC